jgi:hypothetical protein
MRTVWPIAAISILLLNGCVVRSPASQQSTPSLNSMDLLLPDDVELTNASDLTRGQVQTDLQVLRYSLNHAYAGQKFIDSTLFASALREIADISDHMNYPVNTEDLLELVDGILLKLPDNHLSAQSPMGPSKVRRKVARVSAVGKNILAEKSKHWMLTWKGIGQEKVGVLSITHLPEAQDPAWAGFKDAVGKWLTRPFAILDLRGNGGGSDEMMAWLSSRLSGTPRLSPYKARFTRQTPETKILQVNATKLQILMYRYREQTVPPYLLDNLKRQWDEYEKARSHNDETYQETIFSNLAEAETAPSYRGRLFVLIDAACVSSCEGGVKFLDLIPGVVTVGENTGGFFHFGNVGLVVLPNSKLIVQMGSSYFKLRDNSFLEKTGIRPAVQVPTGQDALQFTLGRLLH